MMVLQHCQWCGPHIMHNGPCPRVKAVEYYQDGTVKRVEFRDETLYANTGPPIKPNAHKEV